MIAAWANKYRDRRRRDARRLDPRHPQPLRHRRALLPRFGFNAAATFDRLNPNILLFDGDGPDAKFAGVSYILNLVPEGFTGPYDSWHSHKSVCSQGATIMSLTEENSPVWLTESECAARGWTVRPLANDQMMHLWIGPEYIDGAAIFAHDHPLLYDGYNPRRDV